MRRLLMVLLVAASLLPEAVPALAQATADQLNKLSLEALTAPSRGGYSGRAAAYPHRYAARSERYGRPRAARRSYARSRSYAAHGRSGRGSYAYRSPYGGRRAAHRYAGPSRPHRYAPRSHRPRRHG